DILHPGDTIVDGGNSNFRDSQRRHAEAGERGLHFVDVGVSGGIWGLEVGFCLMAGGDEEPTSRLRPIFESLAPEDGWAHVGASGEGRWTIAEAIAENVPVPVITAALFARFASRQDESFAAQVNAALRNQFGGHAVHAVEQAKASTTDPR